MSNLTLEERISKIEARNKEVELNKAWESSLTRRGIVAIFTYLAIALYLKFVVRVEPWLNAIIPTVGFLLSTLTIPFFKTLWSRYIYKK